MPVSTMTPRHRVVPRDVRVNWGHRLAPRGGWGACPGTGYDFYNQPGMLTANASFGGQSRRGTSISTSSASTGGIQFPFPSFLRNATKALTLVTLTNVTLTNVSYASVLTIRDNTSDATPFLVAYTAQFNSTNAQAAIRDQGGTYREVDLTGTGYTTDQGMRLWITVIDTPTVNFYRDAELLATGTLPGSPTGISYPTTPPGVAVNGYGTATTTQGIGGRTALALIYPWALNANERASLTVNPFQMLM